MVNILWERLFPGRAFVPMAKKILATNFVSEPILFFPAFYSLREWMARPQEVVAVPYALVCSAIPTYRKNFLNYLYATWAVWFPGHAITYGLMLVHMKMPWIALVSFGYLCILSFMRGVGEK